MPTILRVKGQWSGFQGAPGVNVFHFGSVDTFNPWTLADAQSCADRVKAFYQGCQIQLPPQVSINVLADVEEIDANTGDLQNVWGVTAPTTVLGNGGAVGFPSSAGAVVSWKTTEIRRKRRMRGRTFLVPLAGSCYETNGTLTSSTVSTIQGAATTLRTSAGNAKFGVYGRPSTPTATDGLFAQAVSNSVPDMAAVLRSRRD